MKKRIDLFLEDAKKLAAPAIIFLIYILLGRIFLHSLCPSVIVTGFPCPACGMTRAMFSIFHGNFREAWQLQPFSYAIIALIIGSCIWRYMLLKDMKMIYNALIVLLVGMILFYIYRMVVYFPGEPPMSYYYGSYLGRLLKLFG